MSMLPSFLYFGVKKSRRQALYILFAYQLAIGLAALLFNLSLYPFIILFIGVPGVVLAYLVKQERKLAIEALIFSIPGVILIDLVAHVSRAWNYWPSESLGIYFGYYPLIAFVWGFLYWFFIVAFYEYFYDHSTRKTIPYTEKILIPILLALCALFLYATNGQNLYVPYDYALIIAAFFLFNIVLMRMYRYSFWMTYLPVLSLLPIFCFLHEWLALTLNYWSFAVGNHLAYVVVPGVSSLLPVEEILWFFIVNHSVILLHETLADNKKF